MTTNPPGAYVIRWELFTGTNRDVTEYYDMTLTLVDPCPAAFALNSLEFADGSYTLRDADYVDDYANDLAFFNTEAAAHCGQITYNFYMHIDGAAAVTLASPFIIDYTAQKLRIPTTQDVSVAGVYEIYFTATADNYPSVAPITSASWDVTIIDPCKSPVV